IRERDRPRYDELVREIGALYPDLDAVDYEARSGAARARLGNEFDEQIVQCRKSGGAENFFLGTCKQTARIVWHVSKELIPILRREAGLLRYFASQYDDSRIRDAQAATQGLLESFGKWKKTLDPI